MLPMPHTVASNRGVPIIGTADISATDMLIFTVSVIGTDKLQSQYKCRYSASELTHAKERIAAKS